MSNGDGDKEGSDVGNRVVSKDEGDVESSKSNGDCDEEGNCKEEGNGEQRDSKMTTTEITTTL